MRAGNITQSLLGRAQDRAFLGQFGFFPIARVEPVQLGKTKGQFVRLGGGPGDFRPQGFDILVRGAPVPPTLAKSPQLPVETAEGVQQGPVRAGVQQSHSLMLAMDLEKRLAHLLEDTHARRLIIDERAAAAVGAERAPQNQILVTRVGKAFFLQQVPDRMVRRGGEQRRGRSLGRAPPHQPRIGTRPCRQAQGVQDDRLAGPGLTGQHGEPRPDGQIQGLDQHNVADP